MNVVAGAQSAVHGNDFELIPTVKMESRHFVEGPIGHEFSSGIIDVWNRKSLAIFAPYSSFLKKDPLRGNFQNFVPKGFTYSQIHVLCANFVKFSRPEMGSRALFAWQKTKFRLALSLSLLCGSPQNLPGLAADNVLTAPRFHPNGFTSGGVRSIAEHVNTVQTRHKVFSTLGGDIAY